MVIFPCYLIFMTFQAVRELLGIRDVYVEKNNKKGTEKNKSTIVLNECVSDSLSLYESLQSLPSTFNLLHYRKEANDVNLDCSSLRKFVKNPAADRLSDNCHSEVLTEESLFAIR